MLIRAVQLHTMKDLQAFLEDLQKHGLVELIQDGKGDVRVKTDVRQLAEHLFIASDGNTYLVRTLSALLQDIQALVRDMPIFIPLIRDIKEVIDKTPLFFGDVMALLQDLPASLREIQDLHKSLPAMLRSNLISSQIEFITNDDKLINVAELRQLAVNPQDMLLNTPLAEALASIRYVKGSADCLKMAWPQSSQTSLFPMVFPVLTLDGYSYDSYALMDWLEYCEAQRLPLQHPNPNDREHPPLNLNISVINKTLHELIKLNVQLVEKRKLKYLMTLASGKSISNKKRSNETLRILRKISNDYELSLLHNTRTIDCDDPSIPLMLRRNEELEAQYPQFKEQSLKQLDKLHKDVVSTIQSYFSLLFAAIGLGTLSFVFACISITGTIMGTTEGVPLILAVCPLAAAVLLGGIANIMLDNNYKVMAALEELRKNYKLLARDQEKANEVMSSLKRNQRCHNDLAIIDTSKQAVREKITDLRATAQSEIWDGVLCLIESGVDVNQNNLDGGILLSAVVAGRWDVATSLIENGLAINEQNKDSFYFALKLMITTKDWVKTDYLIRHGALHYAQNPDRKEIKTTLKEVGKWTDLSASHRLFKASDTSRVRGRNDHNINQPRMMN